jgi:predicted N-formylglutamate amidohydrolase
MSAPSSTNQAALLGGKLQTLAGLCPYKETPMMKGVRQELIEGLLHDKNVRSLAVSYEDQARHLIDLSADPYSRMRRQIGHALTLASMYCISHDFDAVDEELRNAYEIAINMGDHDMLQRLENLWDEIDASRLAFHE